MDVDSCWAREPKTLTINSEVSVWVFELDGDVQQLQFPKHHQTVLCVSGKAGDGLHENLIYPALSAI